MRRSTIWFAIAAFWLVDGLVVLYRHRIGQAGLTMLFAVAFCGAGMLFRRGERGRE